MASRQFKQVFKRSRQRQNISISALARHMGVSRQAIYNIETGKHLPRQALIDAYEPYIGNSKLTAALISEREFRAELRAAVQAGSKQFLKHPHLDYRDVGNWGIRKIERLARDLSYPLILEIYKARHASIRKAPQA